jgi:hypothetical protein
MEMENDIVTKLRRVYEIDKDIGFEKALEMIDKYQTFFVDLNKWAIEAQTEKQTEE